MSVGGVAHSVLWAGGRVHACMMLADTLAARWREGEEVGPFEIDFVAVATPEDHIPTSSSSPSSRLYCVGRCMDRLGARESLPRARDLAGQYFPTVDGPCSFCKTNATDT